MVFKEKKIAFLITSVCIAAILSMLSFSLWPVFLIQLGETWKLSNTDIGLISWAYFIGYVVATPVLVGLTDTVDAKRIFLGGCSFGIVGCLSFTFLAEGFWLAFLSWGLVGAGLAGTYMPGLQILNARLTGIARIKAVPWYTSCFGIGTGFSFSLMGYLLVYFNHELAALAGAIGSFISAVIILICVPQNKKSKNTYYKSRHPLDLRPAFSKPLAMGYILSYGAHTFELFAYRSWSFALFVFLGKFNNSTISFSTIANILTLITLTGMVASIIGARLCLNYKRSYVICLVGFFTFCIAIASAIALNFSLWVTVGILWIYNMAIMLDSGALTAGSVEASNDNDRGAVLAVHSMIGFLGGALGGPIVGLVLDLSGGAEEYNSWFWAILAMGVGSLIVFLIQLKFWNNNRT